MKAISLFFLAVLFNFSCSNQRIDFDSLIREYIYNYTDKNNYSTLQQELKERLIYSPPIDELCQIVEEENLAYNYSKSLSVLEEVYSNRVLLIETYLFNCLNSLLLGQPIDSSYLDSAISLLEKTKLKPEDENLFFLSIKFLIDKEDFKSVLNLSYSQPSLILGNETEFLFFISDFSLLEKIIALDRNSRFFQFYKDSFENAVAKNPEETLILAKNAYSLGLLDNRYYQNYDAPDYFYQAIYLLKEYGNDVETDLLTKKCEYELAIIEYKKDGCVDANFLCKEIDSYLENKEELEYQKLFYLNRGLIANIAFKQTYYDRFYELNTHLITDLNEKVKNDKSLVIIYIDILENFMKKSLQIGNYKGSSQYFKIYKELIESNRLESTYVDFVYLNEILG